MTDYKQHFYQGKACSLFLAMMNGMQTLTVNNNKCTIVQCKILYHRQEFLMKDLGIVLYLTFILLIETHNDNLNIEEFISPIFQILDIL